MKVAIGTGVCGSPMLPTRVFVAIVGSTSSVSSSASAEVDSPARARCRFEFTGTSVKLPTKPPWRSARLRSSAKKTVRVLPATLAIVWNE